MFTWKNTKKQMKFCNELWDRITKDELNFPYRLAQDVKRLRRELLTLEKILKDPWRNEVRE